MKKFLAGLIVGLILAATTLAYAAPATIKLIVNGQEIQPDVPPQMINGRVMVPA
ncbi:MAG: stalk domain-containing protein, partial [Candidatus Desulforudaceae bacterium]